MIKDILSDNISIAGKIVKKEIKADRENKKKLTALEGLKYYEGLHDILNYKIYFVDSNGILQEEKDRSNIKIPHMFHKELVDQKVQYLLSNPIEIKTEDDGLREELKKYINESFQEMLQDAVSGASNKGLEFIYAYRTANDLLGFQIADSLGVKEYVDHKTGTVWAILRYYETMIEDKDGREVKITKAEVWTDKQTTYYAQSVETGEYILDPDEVINPRPHVIAEDDKNFYISQDLEMIPFFKVQNNKEESTDLQPIKGLIDDYDLMACSLSNNLQDFADALYVVKGFAGDNLDDLVKNIKTRKTVAVDEQGSVDVKTIDIPVTARTAKLDLDKEGIYKFGMGFDSTQVGDGNITNIVIKARYSLLNMKANKTEIRLRKTLRQILQIIVGDINRRLGKAYNHEDLEIEIVREMMVNEDSLIMNAKTDAERKKIMIEVITMATELSDESKLRLICEILDLDYDEELERLEEAIFEQTGGAGSTDLTGITEEDPEADPEEDPEE